MTLGILIITLLVSFYCFQRLQILERWMLQPYYIARGKRLHTLFTSGLIHADFQHLLFNMLSFFFFAPQLEQMMVYRSGDWGHLAFGLIYLLALPLSDVFTVIQHRDNYNYRSLGASGAVSAVIFSSILFNPYSKIGLMFIPIGIPAPIYGIMYVAYSFYASRRGPTGINHAAHLSGAFVGLILTLIFFPGIGKEFIEKVM
jgi:membrane associated rhomboid family serine protease